MITVRQLFLQRLSNEWKFQFGVWRTAIDWTVALYMVIPTLVAAIKVDIDWWKVPPAWLSYLSFSSFAAIPLLFTLTGNIRVFVEEADQLFLCQRGGWMKQLRKLSLTYSIIINLISTCLLFMYLAPLVLVHYKLSFTQLIMWSLFCLVIKTVLGLTKQLVSLRYYGWRQRFALWLIFLVGVLYYQGSLFLLVNHLGLFTLTILLLFFLLILLVYRRINGQGNFLQDVAREQVIKLRYASLFLRAAFAYTSKSRTLVINNRPLLFGRSNPLFKDRNAVNLLTEACVKSVIRSKDLFTYVQLIVLCLAIIVSFPLEWAWLIWFGLAFLLSKFVELFWRKTKNAHFLQLFPWQAEDQNKAASQAIFILMLIGFLPLSFALGMRVYSWLGALALLVVGGVIGYYVAKAVAAFS